MLFHFDFTPSAKLKARTELRS